MRMIMIGQINFIVSWIWCMIYECNVVWHLFRRRHREMKFVVRSSITHRCHADFALAIATQIQYIFYDTYGPLFAGDRVCLGDEYMGRLLIQCSLSPCRQNDGLTSS